MMTTFAALVDPVIYVALDRLAYRKREPSLQHRPSCASFSPMLRSMSKRTTNITKPARGVVGVRAR